MKKIALIIAGGTGQRMGQDIPKQFIKVEDKPVIIYTLEAFQNHIDIDGIVVVCVEGWKDELQKYAKEYNITKLKSITHGGKNGQQSIKNGLDEILKYYSDEDMVLVHDAIRPMVSEEVITDNIEVCKKYGNATAVLLCNTVVLEKTAKDYSKVVVDRDDLWLTQTPQAFILGDIMSAHEEASKKGITNAVASCSLYVDLGRDVYVSCGDERNIKLTTPEDMMLFYALLYVSLNNQVPDWIRNSTVKTKTVKTKKLVKKELK